MWRRRWRVRGLWRRVNFFPGRRPFMCRIAC
ncbi:hypothetical protein H206_05130 [Candidatus Electrothrix aarhusensis]|uniref:Uncharacterized protein n=1 Tax=Candidatus Electrothrix aarhusensis TaxID=1859131 RepID=A0A444J5E6_9BACT|nr:hypothetical protein H206_05130 [Candidatus Electrothrix aarhusensis]